MRKQTFDFYGNEERSFTEEERRVASMIMHPIVAKIDRLWFDAYDELQNTLEISDEDAWLLTQKILYKG